MTKNNKLERAKLGIKKFKRFFIFKTESNPKKERKKPVWKKYVVTDWTWRDGKQPLVIVKGINEGGNTTSIFGMYVEPKFFKVMMWIFKQYTDDWNKNGTRDDQRMRAELKVFGSLKHEQIKWIDAAPKKRKKYYVG